MLTQINKLLCRCLIVMVVFLNLAACATMHAHDTIHTQSMQQGMEYFNNKKYRAALYKLTPEAQRGNPEAQYAVGYMYFYGKGIIQDRKIATQWFEASASQGDPLAINAVKQIRLDQKVKEKVVQHDLDVKTTTRSKSHPNTLQKYASVAHR